MKTKLSPMVLCGWFIAALGSQLSAQTTDSLPKPAPDKEGIKFNISADGSRYVQVTLLNQTWVRFNQSNDGTQMMGKNQDYTFDIGLRRTRMQVLAQVTDRVFLYFQFGQNNFNRAFNSTGNRKLAPFFHDAVCEYRVTKSNQLKIGAGLTIANGLSRFSQPSIGTVMTMDVPVFAQATVDQTDEFSRKLSIYARGQVGKFDYRVSLSDPFPVSSNGSTPPAISTNSNFTTKGHTLQGQAMVFYQVWDKEGHTTPYMTGTHLGKKKVLSIGGGVIYQPKAMWNLSGTNNADTTYSNMLLACGEAYLDIPLNKEKETALSAYLGYYYYNFGKNYLRYNGIMNPATGTSATNAITGQGSTFGNAFPMFGTGHTIYSQIGYLMPKAWFGGKSTFMPYASIQASRWERLQGNWTVVWNAGASWLIKGHKAKISLDYQNRPTYFLDTNNDVKMGKNKSCIVLQFQIFI